MGNFTLYAGNPWVPLLSALLLFSSFFSYLNRLPVFNAEDRQLVRGTYDFFAMSHFSTKLVTHAKEDS